MVQQQVQQEAVRLSNHHQLGVLQKEYGWNTCGVVFLIVFFTLWIGMTLSFFLIGIGIAITGRNILPVFFSLIAFAMFLLGVMIIRHYYQLRHSQVFLYEYGYVAVKCGDEQIVASEAIHWRDIAIIWHRVKRSTSRSSSGSESTTITHIYTLQRLDGTLVGSSLGKNAETTLDSTLGRHIEQMTLPYLLPQAITIYQQGWPVHFGPLTLHAGGIEYQVKVLPWSDFDRLNMNESYGQLSILQKGGQQFLGYKKPWATLPYIQVPNLVVFQNLILSITGSAHP